MSETQSRLVGIDLLRFLAAASVAVFHLAFWTWAKPGTTASLIVDGAAAYPELAFASWWGRFGVEVFFVISGFVIAYSAAQSSAPRFLRARILRLVPAVLICATLTLAVALIASRLPASKLAILYLKALTFFPYGPWIDGVYWTLPIEISFYALVLALLWMRCFDRLELVMAAVGLSSAAYWIARFAGVGGKGRAFELLLVSHGCLFALGVFIWLGVFKGWRWWRVAAVGLLIPAGYLCVMLQAKFFAALALPPASPHVAANLWLASVVFIVVSAELDEIIQTSIPGAGLRALRFLGLMTYPLYLLNDLIGAAIIGGLARSGVDRHLALAAALAAVVALAAAVTAWAEPAVRRVLAARLSGLATRDEARTA